MIRALAIRLLGRFIPLRLSIMCNKPASTSPGRLLTDDEIKQLNEEARRRARGQSIADANNAADRAKGWAT